MATVSELALELMAELGESSQDLEQLDQFESWIREGYERIVSAGRWPHANLLKVLETTAHTRVYTMDDVVAEVITVIDTTGNTVVGYNTLTALARLGFNVLAEGNPPIAWYYEGVDESTNALKLGFYPVPDDAYSLRLVTQKRASTLSSSTVIPFTSEFLNAIRSFVRVRYRMVLDDGQLVQIAQAEFDTQLTLLTARYLKPLDEGGSRTRRSWLREVNQAPPSS